MVNGGKRKSLENYYLVKMPITDRGLVMNTYYSKIGRLLDERTPIYQEGYFVLCENNEAKFSLEKPEEIEVVTSDSFVNSLVEGCKNVINSFATSRDNKNVYAFNLYADEHYSFYIYLNTLLKMVTICWL
jgi:hypothetical protein